MGRDLIDGSNDADDGVVLEIPYSWATKIREYRSRQRHRRHRPIGPVGSDTGGGGVGVGRGDSGGIAAGGSPIATGGGGVDAGSADEDAVGQGDAERVEVLELRGFAAGKFRPTYTRG